MKKIYLHITGVLALGVMIGACTSPLLEDGDVLSASLGLQKSVVRDASAVWIDEPDADLCEGVALSATSVEVNGTDHLIIRDQEGLAAIRDDLAAHYILCSDIEIDPTSPFTRINSYAAGEFTGTLEGNGRTIRGLKITRSNSNFVGLFGVIGESGKVRNLGISLVNGDATTPSISGKRHVGALAGENRGIIRNVAVTGGYVKGNSSIGGLVGTNHGEIIASYATGNVAGDNTYIGGLIGYNNSTGTLTNSYATGTVEGDSHVGGLVGFNDDTGTIENSHATGSVEGAEYIGGLIGSNGDNGIIETSYATGNIGGGSYLGGLVGRNAGGIIENSYATGNVGEGSYIGGLVGRNAGGIIENSYATGSVKYATGSADGSSYIGIGGLVGWNSGEITASYFDVKLTGQSQLIGNEPIDERDYYTNSADGQVYTEADGAGALIAQDNFSAWDFDAIWDWQGDGQWPLLRDNSGDNPEASEGDRDTPVGLCAGLDARTTSVEVDGSDYLIIRDQVGLAAIRDDLAAHYILCNDIRLDATFTQINLDTNDTTTDDFEGGEFSGTLEGNGRTISGLKITRSSSNFVGLFGKIGSGGEVRNLELSLVDGDATTPSISGGFRVGALAGESEGTLENVAVIGGHVQGEGNYIGGLVGHNNGEIAESYVTSSVEGDDYIGGLVGRNNGEIATSYVTSSVEGDDYIGGLVGRNYGEITESYVTSSVEGNDYIGGLAGYNYGSGEIADSYATGSVEGANNFIGGLVGRNDSGTITRSYATGSVEGTGEYIGGLAGYNNNFGRIVLSYFDATTTGWQYSGHGTVFYTYNDYVYTQNNGNGSMIAQDDFSDSDWDFIDTWVWQGDGQWPLLRDNSGDDPEASEGENSENSAGEDLEISEGENSENSAGGDPETSEGGDSEASEGEDLETSEGGNSENSEEGNPEASEGDRDTPVGLCAGLDARTTSVEVDGSDYLIIRDQVGLAAIGDDLAAHYILCNDIRLDETFTQINLDTDDTTTDDFEGGEFSGTLEGNGRTISGLAITRSSSNFVGLFGKIGEGGEVRNLELSLVEGDATTPSISGGFRVGALAGENEGRIENVVVTGGYIKGEGNYIGGLVGVNYGEITTSYGTSSVEGDEYIGGLVGRNYGEITQSYVTSSVEGDDYIGGLAGYNYGSGEIADSYATGSVEGINDFIGGLVGRNDSGTIARSYATNSVEGTSEYIGGLAGYNNSNGEIVDSYIDATTTGRQYRGHGIVFYTYNDYVYTQNNGNGSMIAQDDFSDWDFTYIWHWQGEGQWPLLRDNSGDDSEASEGEDSETSEGDSDADSDTHLDLCADLDASATSVEVDGSDYLIIRDQEGLAAIGDDLAAHYILCNDIRFDDTFTQINLDTDDTTTDDFEGGEFSGTLEGNGRTISGLKITRSSSNFVGLFGKIGSGGEVKNLGVSLADGDAATPSISGKSYVGALAGENEGRIENVAVTGGYVQGEGNYIGGLVGRNSGNGTITESYVTSSVEGDDYIGGLVGRNNGEIATSYVTSSVEGDDYIGGLVGRNYGEITESYVTSSVDGNDYIGGLAGYNYGSGEIADSYATGSVEGANNFIGGLVGRNDSGTITRSYATGSVEGTGEYIGGLAGYNNNFGRIVLSYFDATTTGRRYSGHGTVFYTYNDYVYTQNNGNGSMIVQDDFSDSDWDFDTIWDWQGDGQWPLLRDNSGDDSEASEGEDLETSEGGNSENSEEGNPEASEGDSDTPVGLCVGLDARTTSVEVDGSDYLIIRDQVGLAAIGDDLAAHYILCNDIRLDETFTQINLDTDDTTTDDFEGGEFSGTLEGNGRTISGLAITRSSSNFVGLFGKIGEGGEVRNLELSLVEGDATTPSISGGFRVGALAGENEGRIENVVVTGGYIKGEGNYIGGLVGVNYGEITTSYGTSSVEGDEYIGGLVGRNYGEITQSYVTSSVEGDDYIGGLAGYNYGSGEIADSYATGSVEGINDFIGGLVGRNDSGTIARSYATNSVEGTSEYIGGLAGYNNSNGEIVDSYIDATTTGRQYRGHGIVFYTYNDYVYTQNNGNGSMIAQDDFSDWDFTYIWHWQENGRWPILKFETE